jgi:sulfur relay (sulfurtransferase) complex TusBCD TusD component (DsrE family)
LAKDGVIFGGRKTPPRLDVKTCQLDVQGHSEEKDFEVKVCRYLECSYLMDKMIMEPHQE